MQHYVTVTQHYVIVTHRYEFSLAAYAPVLQTRQLKPFVTP